MKKLIPFFVLGLMAGSVHDLAADPPHPPTYVKEELFREIIIDPIPMPTASYERVEVTLPTPEVKIIEKKPTERLTTGSAFVYDNEVSWYGPGFYGNRTACGLAYTTSIMGVAHRTLPCGTLVDFRFKGKTIRVPVIDRGPYVAGREWDLSGGLCVALDHCFTGPIEYRIIK